MEYRRDVEVDPRFRQTEAGLELEVVHYQRIYNMEAPPWPNPIVVKLTHVEPVGEASEQAGGDETRQAVPGEEVR